MNRRFDAFLSYSRQASGPVAVAVQNALQRFAKPWYQLRAIRVFRDDASLAANTKLWGTIAAGLDDSGWLILLASPAAAVSEYVDREVQYWLASRGDADRILVVHCAGTIGWDRVHGTFTAETNCIPPSLARAYAEEPRWIDLTWWDDVEDGQGDPRFMERVADLSAAIREVDRDALIGEDVRQHRRARRLSRAAIVTLAVLLVTSLAAALLAVRSAEEAARQRDAALESLVASRARVTAATDLETALVWADTAHRSAGDPASAQALHEVASATPELLRFFHVGGQVSAADATPDAAVVVAGTASGNVVRFDQAAGESATLGQLAGEIEFVGVSADGRTVVASARQRRDDDVSGRTTWTRWVDGVQDGGGGGRVAALSPSGGSVAVIPAEGFLEEYLLQVHINDQVWDYTTGGLTPSWVVLPDDESVAAMNEYGEYLRATHGNAESRGRIPMGTYMFGGSLAADGVHFTYTNGGSMIEVWDLSEARGPDIEVEAQLAGWTESAAVTGITLDSTGGRLVTAADGKLQVSRTGPPGGERPPVRVLEGAGPAPHALRFVGPDILVSAAGGSVAVWDLSRTMAMGTSYPVPLQPCRSCGLYSVAVNDARTAAVAQLSNADFHIVDLGTGRDQQGEFGSWAVASATGAWIDDQRLLVVNLGAGEAMILSQSGPPEPSITLPSTECSFGEGTPWGGTARRDDGQVVVLTDRARILIDPSQRTAQCHPIDAVAVTSDGNYLLRVPADQPAGTVELLSADDLTMIASARAEGTPLGIAERLPSGRVAVLVHDDDAGTVRTVEIDVDTGDIVGGRFLTTASSAWRVPLYGAKVNRGRMVTLEGNTVALYDLETATRVPLLDVGTSVISEPGFGFSPDGRTLAVSSEGDGALHVIPLDPDEWSSRACGRVWGADGGPDLAGILVESPSMVAGCAS
ncbi:TIR domain-containing protein [Tessaracoccus defluvii]|uniref:TIR domain-containing protein n=1 Tax=Tessaracoccus defluvii TaxID=1285901 RepID=A0A7H0H2K6_9ACTN|nr:TIR domain-containing protein [Tessaracoccus defluvii]QNP54772.1 TIR domain-containing protein [Tessaracoccus defluvii]